MKTPREILTKRGHYIRRIRRNVGVTQAELADAMGLDRPSVSAIEAGNRDLTIREGFVIADKLGCDARTLADAHLFRARLSRGW